MLWRWINLNKRLKLFIGPCPATFSFFSNNYSEIFFSEIQTRIIRIEGGAHWPLPRPPLQRPQDTKTGRNMGTTIGKLNWKSY